MKSNDQKVSTTLSDARKAILEKDYSFAARLFERLLIDEGRDAARHAGELMGLGM